jgi:transposase
MNGRVEVITGPERRRRWSDEEKLQLVAEACQPGNSVSQVARERGISASQLFGWRRQMLAKGLITDIRSEASAGPALTFAPVEVKEETAAAFAEQKVSSTRRHVALLRFTGGLARPSGNATGFVAISLFEKYMETLKEIAPCDRSNAAHPYCCP